MSRVGVFHAEQREAGLIPAKKHTYNNGGRNKGILRDLRTEKRQQAEARQENEKQLSGMRRVEELCKREGLGPNTERALNVARKVLKPSTFDRYVKRWVTVDGPGVDF